MNSYVKPLGMWLGLDWTSLRKQPIFRDVTTGFPRNDVWAALQKFHTDVHYTDLGSASDWLTQISLATRPIRSNAQIRVMTSHWYGIGYFQVASNLYFKARLREKPLLRKWFLIMMQIKLIFTTKVSHLASFWKWDFWNSKMAHFCSRCSHVISQGNKWWPHEYRLFTLARLKLTLYKWTHNFS